MIRPAKSIEAKTVGKLIQVAIADDHAILRSGLRMLIQSQPDMQVVAEAENGIKAIEIVSEHVPDALLLDLTMPGLGGMQALPRLLAVQPQLRILVLTMHDDVAYARSALAAGARGFVLKRSVDAELLAAIRAVHRGGTFIDPTLTEALVGQAIGRRTSGDSVLSKREEQVLCAFAEGFAPKEIAARLHLSVKTIETYRARISEKLELRTRNDMVRYCLEAGLLTAERASSDKP